MYEIFLLFNIIYRFKFVTAFCPIGDDVWGGGGGFGEALLKTRKIALYRSIKFLRNH